MVGLAFRFPGDRYHATPWRRNVNEADVAWPPEPWRILRALIACYWRKGDQERWNERDLERLIEALADDLPVFHLPEGTVHAHSRHYMPIRKGRKEVRTLVFDAFVHLPKDGELRVFWPNVALGEHLLDLVRDLADGLAYLGRAESWTECRVLTEEEGKPNCGPIELGFEGELCRVLLPRSRGSYRAVRDRLVKQEAVSIQARSRKRLTDRALRGRLDKAFLSRHRVDTLPSRLLDALTIDTADLHSRKWDQPPAAYEAVYARDPDSNPRVVAQPERRRRRTRTGTSLPTVARYVLAGRPRPRIENAVKIGEVMRAAAMSQFGWQADANTGRRVPRAPWLISGRIGTLGPVRDPTHPHAFWLPEDADDDGWIDHVTVFVAGGMDAHIRMALDRITRLFLKPQKASRSANGEHTADEWRLALEGFGTPTDFTGSSPLLARSRMWRTATPFLASAHLKKSGHVGELKRLLERRGIETTGLIVKELAEITIAGTPRRTLHFHRFRSRGQERQHDSSGAFLEIEFPMPFQGPLTLGYASHFGLGMFVGKNYAEV